MNYNADVRARFEAIDWNTINLNAAYEFYESIGRPLAQRALLVAPIAIEERDRWQRECVADLTALQGRGCPGCAA
ncbi:hypothetical protein GWG65_02975 [Bradyrhizobium sp. CSA207]|uniref:hypothetical protein n=1 Tax=Bradyrhizobium sp. CSA207 TaxID=2698826 RepID=UPI0023B0ED6C|nr:hypothetical protein [Bradyrhizobium sp. CSA207]MDE5440426.1 hypothetical protein [Bradyrhizobium sp. CSA207]